MPEMEKTVSMKEGQSKDLGPGSQMKRLFPKDRLTNRVTAVVRPDEARTEKWSHARCLTECLVSVSYYTNY